MYEAPELLNIKKEREVSYEKEKIVIDHPGNVS